MNWPSISWPSWATPSGLRSGLIWLGVIIAVAGFAALRLVAFGRNTERSRQDAQSLDNLRSRERTEDEVDRLGDADRRERLGEWVRQPDSEKRL